MYSSVRVVRRRTPAPPTTSPSWYAQNDSRRRAVIDGSFWRRLPAAALRGFTSIRTPAASYSRLSASNTAVDM